MKSLLDDVKNLNFTLPSECVTIFGSARFDDNNEFRLGDKTLIYDQKYGLIVKKEDENEWI